MGFLRRPQNLKKSSSYFWQECRVLCAQQRTCQKVDEDFFFKMWTSRIIQTLTTLSQPKCVYCASPQDLYTITLFLFIYSIQINNEKKGWPDWLTHSGQYGWPQLHRVQILLKRWPHFDWTWKSVMNQNLDWIAQIEL